MKDKNENRRGYKKTKVGWIPEGWRNSKLGNVCKIRRGASPRPIRDPKWFSSSGRGWVRIADVTQSKKYLVKTSQTLSVLGEEKSVNVDPGELIMSICATIGVPRIVDTPVCIHDGFVRFQSSQLVDTLFLFFLLTREGARLSGQGQPGTQKNINTTIVNGIMIPLPPLPEQEAIASVLECWDNAIQRYEEKIQKKKNIKKGLMQRLLTGKQRLPGFDGEWVQKSLGDLGRTFPGLSGKTIADFGSGEPFVTYMNVFSNQVVSDENYGHVSISKGDKQNTLNYGDVLFTTSSETPNEVGMSSVFLSYRKNVYLNSFCFGFRLNSFSEIEPAFAQYLFRSKQFRRSMTRIAQGASRYNLSKRYFLLTEVLFPPLPEQKAIASVLSTADAEIKALEKKVASLQDQKKFLLNNLVTGTIRLPEFCKEVV